jgi:hypothetical protein
VRENPKKDSMERKEKRYASVDLLGHKSGGSIVRPAEPVNASPEKADPVACQLISSQEPSSNQCITSPRPSSKIAHAVFRTSASVDSVRSTSPEIGRLFRDFQVTSSKSRSSCSSKPWTWRNGGGRAGATSRAVPKRALGSTCDAIQKRSA